MTELGGRASAARRYKDITGGMTEAVARMRRDDAEHAERLAETLFDLHERMVAAGDREALTVLTVALQWDSALDDLWNEQWMTLAPMPKPDPNASARDLDYLDAVVAQRYEALREAIRRRPLIGRR